MLIFQRMQILCAALLLGVSSVLVGCGSARQAPTDDENLVVVYNCGAEDWTDPIAKETARRKVPCAVTVLVGTRPFTL